MVEIDIVREELWGRQLNFKELGKPSKVLTLKVRVQTKCL